MCPNCTKETFSAWDKLKSNKLRECSECGVLVRPSFFRSILSMLLAIFLSTISAFITLYIFMRLIGPISFTHIWIMLIPLIVGSLLPTLLWIRFNNWFVPWIVQKT